MHHFDLPLLPVADGLCHDPQADVATAVHLLVGHLHRAGMVETHQPHEERIEIRIRHPAELLDLVRTEHARHGPLLIRITQLVVPRRTTYSESGCLGGVLIAPSHAAPSLTGILKAPGVDAISGRSGTELSTMNAA